jgi:hypothetical protein
MSFILISVIVSIIIFLLTNVIIWIYVSGTQYQNGISLKEGDQYTIGDRTYTFPKGKLIGRARLLNEDYLITQRKLLQNVLGIFNENDIEHWVSGGTLLGFMKHETFQPWDDDIDIHTHWEHKEKLFSSEFNNKLNQYGMETAIFIRSSSENASTIGAAVRIKFIGTDTPMCDVFFTKENNGKICKVENWTKDNINFNKKEQWNKNDIFPITPTEIDGIMIPLVNNPWNTLETQYGDKVKDLIIPREDIVSHQYPLKVFSFLFN